MISKKTAIAALDNYLKLEYNIDPLFKNNYKLKANQSLISQNEYCWIIHQCKDDEVHSENIENRENLGPYFIDKESAEIYKTGNAPHIPYEEEFIYFKTKGQSLLDWFPVKSKYLDAIHNRVQLNETNEYTLKAKYESREIEAKEYLQNQIDGTNESPNFLIRYKPIDGIDCLIYFSNSRVTISDNKAESISVVSIAFMGGFKNFAQTIGDLKKWIRVNKKENTGNYWISINEKDWSKDFNEWQLIANLEYN